MMPGPDLTPETLTAIIFLAVLAAVTMLALALMPSRPAALRRRMDMIAGIRPDAKGGQPAGETSVRRSAPRPVLGSLGRRLQRVVPRASTLQARLARAGLALGVSDFVMIFAGLGLGVGMLAWLKLGLPLLLAAGVGIIAGTGVPNLVLARLIAARTRRFVSLLPDAIDLIVRGVRSGLPVAEAINTIGEEMEEPIGSCFREITGALRLGMPLNEALWTVAERLQIQEFKFFVISLSIQQETGGNLAEILQNLSTMIRRREQVKLKIKAMSSEARASAMIVGSLPFVMSVLIYIINPDYILQLVTDPRGWLLLGIGLTSMTLGMAVMAKMVRFEI
jgi:tight adherence protein B